MFRAIAPWHPRFGQSALPETELTAIARERESLLVFGWKSYMHNPRLRHWLHRIDLPTRMLRGEQNGVVTPTYGQRWRELVAGR